MNHLDYTTLLAHESSSVARSAWGSAAANDSHLWRKWDLSDLDQECFSCPLAECLGEHSLRCPIYQGRRRQRAASRPGSTISAEPVSLFEMSRRLGVNYRTIRRRFDEHRSRFPDVSIGKGRSPRDAYLFPQAAQVRLVELVRGGAE